MSLTSLKEYKPNYILVDFDIIVNCRSLDYDYFVPFLKQHLRDYLRILWNDYKMMILVNDLRCEAFQQRMESSYFNTPLIEEETLNDEAVIKSVTNCIQWQIQHNQETRSCQSIQKLILNKALNQKEIKIDIYEDIVTTFSKWRLDENIKIYVKSEMKSSILESLLAATLEGNLIERIDGIFGKNYGLKDSPETYINISQSQHSDPSKFLFLTNIGRAAKAADQAGMNVVIIKRPEDAIRDYYTTKYPTVDSIEDIQFVVKPKSN